MKGLVAIKQYFGNGGPHGRPVTTAELRALSAEERAELGQLCCAALGADYEPPSK